MNDEAIEQLARRLCQAAHVDPDSMVEPAFAGAGYSSVNPASGLVPAWHRFRSAAENVYGMRSELMRGAKPRR